ncbi:hypothetical protein D7V97_11830 [Corallococcus sp. CA053C]|nr:hypothetical protein D7V97_11830 [Corallococcus sp. CA053C]
MRQLHGNTMRPTFISGRKRRALHEIKLHVSWEPQHLKLFLSQMVHGAVLLFVGAAHVFLNGIFCFFEQFQVAPVAA